MSEIDDVIARLEKATGPDRELDGLIFACIGLTDLQERHCREWCRQNGRTDLTRERYIAAWAPDFSRSIDAALTLVQLAPDGASHWGVEFDRGFEAWVSRNNVKSGHWLQQGFGATPAIALCIAAFKARVALSGSQSEAP